MNWTKPSEELAVSVAQEGDCMENKKLIYAEDLFCALRDDISINGANLAKVKRHIENAPAVDAVEVVHGRWVFWNCSECDYETSDLTNYCPNCGAKMDGDGNG